MRVTVRLNGSAENPYRRMGLARNPFPRIARAEYASADDLLADLDAEPIASEAELRERIGARASDEFVAACVANFRPGERTEFEIEFPEWPREAI
jgi:hypothetical protein